MMQKRLTAMATLLGTENPEELEEVLVKTEAFLRSREVPKEKHIVFKHWLGRNAVVLTMEELGSRVGSTNRVRTILQDLYAKMKDSLTAIRARKQLGTDGVRNA